MNLKPILELATDRSLTVSSFNFYRAGGGVGEASTLTELFDVLATEAFDTVRVWLYNDDHPEGTYQEFNIRDLDVPFVPVESTAYEPANASRGDLFCRNCGRSASDHGPNGCPVDIFGKPRPDASNVVPLASVPLAVMVNDINARAYVADLDVSACVNREGDGIEIDKTGINRPILTFVRTDFASLGDREFADMVFAEMEKAAKDPGPPVDTEHLYTIADQVNKIATGREWDVFAAVEFDDAITIYRRPANKSVGTFKRSEYAHYSNDQFAEAVRVAMERYADYGKPAAEPETFVLPVDRGSHPAFPPDATASGLTVREYFAAAALTGLCALPDGKGPESIGDVAVLAWRIADATIDQGIKRNV
jgi:hypothetical protein